jgi:hypothetical protein
MARISGRIRVAAPVERGIRHGRRFAQRASFNPAMTGVELLTPLPIGLGTRFRARMGKAGGEMLVELTEFERPHRLSSRTISSKTPEAVAPPDHGPPSPRPRTIHPHRPPASESRNAPHAAIADTACPVLAITDAPRLTACRG